MKRLFAKAAKPFALPKSGLGGGINLIGGATPSVKHAHTTGLQPKYLVPPVPHPCPHDHLVLLVTKDGLLIRQHTPGHDRTTQETTSHVRIAWGKAVRIEEVTEVEDRVDWEESVIVYGIIGILELFSGALLPIKSVPGIAN
jgi:hypothetical protein